MATSITTVAKIKKLFEDGCDDLKIANHLTKENIQRRAKKSWDRDSVRRIRYSYGINYPDSKKTRRKVARREDGLYSIRGVAEKLNVKPALVCNWANTGLLPVTDGGGTTRARWFHLDDKIIEKLLEAKAKRYRMSDSQGVE